MTTPHKQGPPSSSFFLKERDRLIAEIADGIEQLLGNTNTVNRKLEESIAVGQEFEPISNLWGRFVDMMSSSGINPPQPTTESSQAHAVNSSTDDEQREDRGGNNALGKSTASDEMEDTLPPGVAPGGGQVYGRDHRG